MFFFSLKSLRYFFPLGAEKALPNAFLPLVPSTRSCSWHELLGCRNFVKTFWSLSFGFFFFGKNLMKFVTMQKWRRLWKNRGFSAPSLIFSWFVIFQGYLGLFYSSFFFLFFNHMTLFCPQKVINHRREWWTSNLIFVHLVLICWATPEYTG